LSCATRRIVGVEALARCHEPGRDELAPVDLIRLAEDAGLITDVTQHVLATALPQVQAWKGLPGRSPKPR
jgi:cyclic di-GMP phosphodiesterase Gmr